MKIYFDNAASTPLAPEVSDAMFTNMKSEFGNPSSIHSFGRQVKSVVEKARKKIAGRLNVSPSEIYFTSGGTEANNMAIFCAIDFLNIRKVITSPIEHYSVLHTLQYLEKTGRIQLCFVRLLADGHIDLAHLDNLLQGNERVMVSLMHANNEIGNLLDMDAAGKICAKYGALFHSDTVQTMGHYRLNLSATHVHLASCSAHKLHGPKGTGFLYWSGKTGKFKNSGVQPGMLHPLLHGGAQERNMRAGTENVHGIAGMAMAFDLAYENMERDMAYIQGLKQYMAVELSKNIHGVKFNGDFQNNSLYTVLNVSFPKTDVSEMLIYHLDIEGIAASGGSACTSGSNIESHVLKALDPANDRPSVRFSFSKYNTKEEIDFCIGKILKISGRLQCTT